MIAWMVGAAWAAEPGVPEDLPELPADTYRPTLDAGPFGQVESSRFTPGAWVGAQASWVGAPIRWADDEGSVVAVIRHAVALHVGARWSSEHLQLGVSAPVYPVVVGARQTRSALGDLSITGKGLVRRHSLAGGGLAALTVPLGGGPRQVGYPGPTVALGLVGTADAGTLHAALNAGVRFTPSTALGEVTVDDQVWYRGGVGLPVSDRTTVAAELAGAIPWRGVAAATVPVEGLITGTWRMRSGPRLVFGAGRGLSAGVGSPAWRLTLGVRWGVSDAPSGDVGANPGVPSALLDTPGVQSG